jgi:hypothetical protein
MTFGWSLDASSLSNGNHSFTLRVTDSTGKSSQAASMSFNVNNPLPTLTVMSPQSGAGIAGTVSVEIAMFSSLGDTIVGISGGNATAVNYASQTSSSARGIPSGTTLWSAGSSKSFTWNVDTSSWPVGSRTISIVVIDRAGQVVEATLALNIQSIKPVATIISPGNGQAVKGKVTVRAFFTASSMAGRTISYVGISESTAQATFSTGAGYYSRLPSKYNDTGVPSGATTFDASWTIDYSKMEIGSRELSIAVQDSKGDITETKIQLTIEKAKPVVQILSPSQNQTISGQINLKVNATSDPATNAKISKIALSSQKFTPQFSASSTYCNVDSNYKCWGVEDLKSYNWTSEPGAFKDGPLTLTVIAFDENGNSTTTSVNVEISAVAPVVTINLTGGTIIERTPFTLRVTALPNAGSGSTILGVGISDKGAIAQFPGTAASAGSSGIPADSAIWRVANIKDLSWRLDPSTWREGDHVINVYALDTNGKLGQASVVIHLAPEATWKLSTQGAAVLGQSVAVIVSMSTSVPIRSTPPIVATLQVGTSSAGPWADTGQLTFDESGQAMGRVLVTEKLYVRVNHPNLDSIQVGVSEPLRIVNVPDPKRGGASSGNEATNEDGSRPRVTCTLNGAAKVNAKISVVCSALDVQDASQPVTIFGQLGSSAKAKLSTAKIAGSKISGTFKVSKAGTYTVILQGAKGKFVPWASNPLKIKVK